MHRRAPLVEAERPLADDVRVDADRFVDMRALGLFRDPSMVALTVAPD